MPWQASAMRRATFVLLTSLVVMSLTGCAIGGDADAAVLAEQAVSNIGDDMSPPNPVPHDAEALAAAAVRSPRVPVSPAADYTVEALSWQGNSGDETGAIIELRVFVHVLPTNPGSVFGSYQQEGYSERCWRLTVFASYDDDLNLQLHEISCPSGALPAPPSPAPTPTDRAGFPPDVDALLFAAIEGATAADVEARVSAAFPEDYYVIQSDSLNGELVVALGITAEFECLVVVIDPDGSAQVYRGFDLTALPAAEQYCSTELYLNPPQRH